MSVFIECEIVPDTLVRFCAMTIPASNIAFPGLGAFADIVDMIMTADDQVDSMAIFDSVLVCHGSKLVCQGDILIISFVYRRISSSHLGLCNALRQ